MDLFKNLIEKMSCKRDFGGKYTVYHFVCKKCGKFKKVKSF